MALVRLSVRALEKRVPENPTLSSACQFLDWPGVIRCIISCWWKYSAGGKVTRGLTAAWRSLTIAGLLLLTVGIPAPLSSRKTSLTFGSPSDRTTDEFSAQQPNAESAAGHLSEPYRSAWFPAAVRSNSHWPTWAYGYLAQLPEEQSPPDVAVYDRQGKQVSQAHVWIPDATQMWLFAAAPTMDGGAIVSGQAAIYPGITYFLAKTSVSGGVVSLIRTETFVAARICTASDDTIWTLGRDVQKESAQDRDYPLVRQYSFEKGLLHNYLSRALVDFRHSGGLGGGEGPNGTFLVCGKDRISLYLNETNEYIEIDPSTESLKRWEMDMTPLGGARVTGLAVTGKGPVYASLFEVQAETETKTHGLFELRTEAGESVGKWIVVNGTLNAHLEVETVPKGAFFRAWGADSDDLVIRRQYDADMSWVRVIP
ncbi:MAG TPA: hypothetical protein VIX11_07040 [Candidatus Acidoferrum sp.]